MNKILIVGLIISFVLGFGLSYFVYYIPINNVETFSIIVANDKNFTDVIHQKNVTWNGLIQEGFVNYECGFTQPSNLREWFIKEGILGKLNWSDDGFADYHIEIAHRGC